MSQVRLSVFVCVGPVCGDPGLNLARRAKAMVAAEGWGDEVSVHKEVCLGYCHQGPNVMLSTGADAWGRAPLAGSPGSETLHGVDEVSLRGRIARWLEENSAGRIPNNSPKG